MRSNKKKIFISHSNPEDNYFAWWLSVKLKQCGYDTWVDVDNLKTGELWNRVHKAIREDSIKFLACISKDYIGKSKNEKSGVYKELVTASTVQKKDFMVPIMTDSSDWNDIPVHGLGFIGIDFSKNWATGLRKLIEALEDEQIGKTEKETDLKNFWYQALKINSYPIKKEERYFANWFKIQEPEKIYIHGLFDEAEFSLIPHDLPFIRVGTHLISFFDRRYIENYVRIRESREEDFKTFVEHENEYKLFGTQIHHPNRKVISLLRKAFTIHFTKDDFFSYEFSNRLGFFNSKKKNLVNLKHLGKTRKSISGTAFKDFNWFYGVSLNFTNYPELFLKVSSRVIFTDKNQNILSKPEQHSLRRKYCNNWFNRDWFELMLAFFAEVSGCKMEYKIPISPSESLEVSSVPINFKTDLGFTEPNEE